MRAAVDALDRAYSPYSSVRVGAALLGADGRIHVGCNVENASYGLTICAERSAVFKAVSEGERSFRGIAIATSLPEPLPPCGACRQVLAEFAPKLPVVLVGAKGRRTRTTLAKLLPHAFGPNDLR